MARPSGDLSQLAAAGVDVVVSLLGDNEAAELGLSDEAGAAARVGLAFHHLATADFGVPDVDATRSLVAELAAALARDQHVVIHCRGGIGRSSVLAAAVLLGDGFTPSQAWARIAEARGCAVPETDAQRVFIDGLVDN